MRFVCGALVSLVLLAAGCPSGGEGRGGIQRVDQEGLVKVITADNARILDPHVTSDGGNVKVMTQLFEGLLRVDPADVNVLIPSLATGWEVSEDGLRIEFTIREGVTFHDGTPLDAAGAKLSLDRMRELGFELPVAPYAPEFQHVTSVEADGMLLTVVLDAPVARVLLRNLSMFCASIVSPAVLEASKALGDAGAASAFVTANPAGTGPFKVDAFDPSAQVTRLVANDAYWEGAPTVRTIVFQPVADESTRFEYLRRADEVLLVDDVPRQHWAAVEASDAMHLHAWWALNVCYLGINAEHAATREPEVRRAIQLAIDREALLAQYEGTARPAYGLVASPMAEYDPDLRVDGWRDDLSERRAAAAALIESSGAKGRLVTIYFPNNPRPYLPRPQDVADTLRQQLRAVGLEARILGVDNTTLFSDVHTGRYELILIGWMTDNGDPDNFYSPLADGADGKPSENNTSRRFDPEVNRALAAARTLTDADERVAAYRAVERRLQGEVRGYVPLVNTKQALAYSTRLAGVEVDGLGHYRFHRARLEAR